MGHQETAEPISGEMTELVRYVAAALTSELPAEVAEKGKHHILDSFAAIISGSRMRAGELAAAYVAQQGGRPDCTVIGTTILTNAPNAALANGMSGHADETDDSHFRGRFHPGCGIVPGALAAAELSKSSGHDLLKAVVLGYDVGTRFNLSMGQTGGYGGGHSTHTVGVLFGASAAAAALLRHSEEQTRHQFSYSIQQACGLPYWARDREHIEKAFDFGGLGARNALSAATMVNAGFTGVDDALSGYNNFFTIFAPNTGKPEEISRQLGVRFEIMDATIKKWCVGSPIQGALDAVMALIAAHDVKASEVEAISLSLPDDRANIVNNRSMPDICLQHLVAVALIDRGLNFVSAHDEERMQNPDLLALRERMTLTPSAELTAAQPPRQVILAIRTKDGRELKHHTQAVKGTPANPMTRAEVAEKALDLTAPILGPKKAQALNDAILGIETLTSVADLRPLLQA